MFKRHANYIELSVLNEHPNAITGTFSYCAFQILQL